MKAVKYYWAHCGVPYEPSSDWWVCMICGERAPGEASQPKYVSAPPNPPESHVSRIIVEAEAAVVSEDDRARFLAFLEANAAEVATWPAWKQRAFQVVVKDGER